MTKKQAEKYVGKTVSHWKKLPNSHRSILTHSVVTGVTEFASTICLTCDDGSGLIFPHNIEGVVKK